MKSLTKIGLTLLVMAIGITTVYALIGNKNTDFKRAYNTVQKTNYNHYNGEPVYINTREVNSCHYNHGHHHRMHERNCH